MTRILASVRDRDEALAALAAGADIIDLKEPSLGPLGAVGLDVLEATLGAVAGRRPVSVTTGDGPFEAGGVMPAVRARAALGPDYIKIGIYETAASRDCLAALAPVTASGTRLVAVLLADALPRDLVVADFAAAGFAGVMIDTLDKRAGPLTEHLSMAQLAAFVDEARSCSLLCGLAGSLGETEACQLAPLRPDYLGFRGALCHGGDRTGGFSAERLARLRRRLADAQSEDGWREVG